MKRFCLVLALVCLCLNLQFGQEAPTIRTIGLEEALAIALSQGMDNKVIESNLAVARALDSQAQAKNNFSLSATAAAGLGLGFDEPETSTLSKSLLSSSGSIGGANISPGVSGGLAFGAAQTRFNLSASQSLGSGVGWNGPTTVGIVVNQTLWDGYPGGILKAAVDKSQLSLQGKVITADSTRSTLVYTVKKSYFSTLGLQRTLLLKQAIQKKQEDLLRQIQATFDLRQASALDLKDATLNALSAAIDTKSAQHDLNYAKIRFANLLGLDSNLIIELAETGDPQVPVATIEEAVKTGLEFRPDIKQLELNVQSAKIDLALANAAANMTINLIGSANLAVDWTSQAIKSAQSIAAGLKIGLPILDSGAAKFQADSIFAQIEIYAQQSAYARKTIETDIRDAFEGLQLQIIKLELAKLTTERYDMKLAILKSQVEHGTASNQDLLEASVDAATYASAYVTAKNTTQLAILQLLNVMGF